MPSTMRILEQRIEQIENHLGIKGITSLPNYAYKCPVDSFVVSASPNVPHDYGTWEMVNSGNLLGGQIGTVYAWKRVS